MVKFLCMYNRKKVEVEATNTHEAQTKAAKLLKARKPWDVIVQRSDTPISTASLG